MECVCDGKCFNFPIAKLSFEKIVQTVACVFLSRLIFQASQIVLLEFVAGGFEKNNWKVAKGRLELGNLTITHLKRFERGGTTIFLVRRA